MSAGTWLRHAFLWTTIISYESGEWVDIVDRTRSGRFVPQTMNRILKYKAYYFLISQLFDRRKAYFNHDRNRKGSGVRVLSTE